VILLKVATPLTAVFATVPPIVQLPVLTAAVTIVELSVVTVFPN
jgi:hypothetical protein